jgi:hypothetical protein
MKFDLRNVKLHKVKQSGTWTNIMLLDEDDDLSLSVKDNDLLSKKLVDLKGKQIDIKLDINQLNNGNAYFTVLAVSQNSSK